jgi:hypothetical protein
MFGGDGDDDSRSVNCDPQGACTVYGYTIKSFGDSTDFLAVHLTPAGAPDWVRTYGGTNRDDLLSAVTTNDGGALLVGMSSSLFYTALKVFSPSRPPRPLLVRVDKSGGLQWAMTIDLYGGDVSQLQFERGVQLADGGFVLVGIYMVGDSPEAHASGEHDWTWKGATPAVNGKGYCTMAVARLSADGHVIWLRRYAVPGDNSAAWSADVSADGHIRVLGHITESNHLIWVPLDADGHASDAQVMTDPAVATPMLVHSIDGGSMVIGWASALAGQPGGLFVERYGAKQDIEWAHGYFYSLPVASMDAALDAAGNLCVVGRLNGGNDSRAVALGLDASGRLAAVATLGESKPTAFTGVGELPEGKCQLVGDTYDYDAKYADIITLPWDSSKDPDGLATKFTRVDYSPKLQTVTIMEASADTKSMHLLPASVVTVQSVPLPAVPKKD